MFRLADLNLGIDHYSPAKALPAVKPDFSLPPLLDEDPIQDRLLGSLRYRTPGVPRSDSLLKRMTCWTRRTLNLPSTRFEGLKTILAAPTGMGRFGGGLPWEQHQRAFPVSPMIIFA